MNMEKQKMYTITTQYEAKAPNVENAIKSFKVEHPGVKVINCGIWNKMLTRGK